MTLSNIANVNVVIGGQPAPERAFGVTVLASQKPTFSERLRYYAEFSDFTADTETGVTSSDAEYTLMQQAFAQPTRNGVIGFGRLDAYVAQDTDITIDTVDASGGTATLTITSQGETWEYEHTYSGGASAEDVATAIQALIDGDATAMVDETDGVGAGEFSIATKAAQIGRSFTATVTFGDGEDGTATVATTVEAVGVSDGLTAIEAEDDTFQGVSVASKADHVIYDAAVWNEARGFGMFVFDTDDSDAASSGSTTDIAARLLALNLLRTAWHYVAESTDWAAWAWLVNRAGVNPDDRATTWANCNLPLVRIPARSEITTTQQLAIEAKGGNYYGGAGGGGVVQPAQMIDGTKPDVLVFADWIKARLESDILTLLTTYSNEGRKIPFEDDGIAIVAERVQRRAIIAVQLGHAASDPAPLVQTVTRASLSSAVIQSGVLPGTKLFIQPSGAIERVDPITVTITYEAF